MQKSDMADGSGQAIRIKAAGRCALWIGILFAGIAWAAQGAQMKGSMNIEERLFGHTPDGKEVRLYVLSNGSGMVAKISSHGPILTELEVPDRQGHATNVVLGFDNLAQYLQGHPGFGATIGRVANRIGKARFTLDGVEYKLAVNNGPNHLHGGLKGFDKMVWETKSVVTTADEASVEFFYLSRDGEENYPGNLSVTVTFTLTRDNALRIHYRAKTDKATPVNLTNHSYFNLAGAGDVFNHSVTIFADRYTPVDDTLIPTGEIADVAGTPLDFRTPQTVGARIDQLKPNPGGYDHNYVLNAGGKALALAARVTEPTSGRVMEVLTTEPGVQLYTGNFLDGKLKGVGGVQYGRHSGLCLETQHFPDAINKPGFPSVVLRPGQTFDSTTVFKFSAK